MDWISVKDELPEGQEDVLCYSNKNGGYFFLSMYMYIYSFFETYGDKKYRKFASRLIRTRFYFIIKIVAALKINGLDTLI